MRRAYFFHVLFCSVCLTLSHWAVSQEPAAQDAPSAPAQATDQSLTEAPGQPDSQSTKQPEESAAEQEPADQPAAKEATTKSPAEPMPLSNPESVARSTSPDAPADTESAEAEPANAEDAAQSEEERLARLKDLLSLVTDNTLFNAARESPAYFGLVKEVLAHTPEELRSKARENPRFNDFYQHPAKHRGELVHLELNLRRVLPLDIKAKNAAGVTKLYELWGWTDEAKAHMYCCITPELPPGLPTEGDIAERVELTGYFFKMQAYQPGDMAPDARNLVAPLIIGRITPAPKAPSEAEGMGNWPFYLIGGFGLIVLLRILMQVRMFARSGPTGRHYRRRPLEPLNADTLSDSLSSDRGLPIRNADE